MNSKNDKAWVFEIKDAKNNVKHIFVQGYQIEERTDNVKVLGFNSEEDEVTQNLFYVMKDHLACFYRVELKNKEKKWMEFLDGK